MNLKYVLIILLMPFLCVGQNKNKTDSLRVMKVLEESANEVDTILKLQKINHALNLSKELKFRYGVYTSRRKIARLKRMKFNIDSSIVEYKSGLKDFPQTSQYHYYLLRNIGDEYAKQSNYDSAYFYFKECIKIGDLRNNKKDITSSYISIGNMWLQKYEYDKAFKSYITADSICESDPELKTSNIRASINNYLGFSVRSTHGNEKSIEFYKIAKELYYKTNNDGGLQEVNVAIAQVETAEGNYDEALKLLNESIAYHEIEAPNLNSYSYAVIVRGFLLSNMKRYTEAEKDYKLYYDLVISSKNKLYERRALGYLGDFYKEIGNYDLAINYYKKAIVESKKVEDFAKELLITKTLIDAYKLNNDLNLALDSYDEYIAIQQKIDKKSITEKTYDLEAKYQTEKKEQQISLLESQNEIIEQQKKNQQYLLLGGISITTLAGLFLFFLYRNRQRTNTKLKELDALKSNFFANISHEFRTPLTLISSPIDDILNEEALSDKKRQQFTIAKQNSDRLLELVNQLLDLSKIDAGHVELHIQEGHVLQLISALSGSFSYHAKQKNIDYTVNIEQSEELGWFDKDAIEKITINLLSNALKYTPENGTINCKGYVENNMLFLEVKNSGKGLTTQELSNIFERFYQTNTQNEGTGIGLALVRELVELHKGKIEVTSTPNKVTTFKLNLAIDRNSFKNESVIQSSGHEVQTEIPVYANAAMEDDNEQTDSDLPILLIVEDNDDLRRLLMQIFKDTYSVISAPNGVVGVEQAIEHIPDLIISDIMMPEKDGITLTKELKNDERSAHIPIILLTAKAEVESQFEGIETGADDYITKPFDKKLLVLKVEKLIASRRQLQLRYSQELVLLPKDLAFTNLDEKFLNKVQDVLDKNLIESSFGIAAFSEAVGMSRMQLHRKLKALTGLTTTEFIRSQRLKLAAQLLKSSDINISQVGYSVGFNDHSYFTKCFKNTYNCTPTEFANRS